MNLQSKKSPVIFLIVLILYSSMINCSNKVQKLDKSNNKLKSRIEKAEIKVNTSTKVDSKQTINSSVKTTYSTGFNSDGNGDIFYLSRHKLSCGEGNALNRFKLARENGKIRYDYTCIYNPSSISSDCTNHVTPNNETKADPTKSINYLERHNVKCSSDKVITEFLLKRSSNSIFYSYTCCKATLKNCASKTLCWQNGGYLQNYYLERQNVDATETKVIQQFKLDYYDGNIRYTMTTCDLA